MNQRTENQDLRVCPPATAAGIQGQVLEKTLLPASSSANRHGRTLGPCHSQGHGHIGVHGHHALPHTRLQSSSPQTALPGSSVCPDVEPDPSRTPDLPIPPPCSAKLLPPPQAPNPKDSPEPGLPVPSRLGPFTLSPEGQMGVLALPRVPL